MRSKKTPSPAEEAAFDPFGRYSTRRQPRHRVCAHPGCPEAGEYRAPKDRNLSDYQWLCLEHVREFNKSWNFFDGLNDAQVEDHIRQDTYWQRPTWKMGRNGAGARSDGPDINDPFGVYRDNVGAGAADARRRWQQTQHDRPPRPDTPEDRALRVMGLDWPLEKDVLRSRYLSLVKQHHPDVNQGDKDAEDRLKEINAAYRLLLTGLNDRT